MKDFTFGISAVIDTGVGTATLNVRYDDSRHEVKSLAGKLFHREDVKSICVFDPFGLPHLYLKKTENGVVREELP